MATQYYSSHLIRISVYGMLLSFFLSCQPEKERGTPYVHQNVSDSIQKWVKELSAMEEEPSNMQSKALFQRVLNQSEQLPYDSLRAKYFSQLSLQFLNVKDSFLFRNVNQRALLFSQKAKDSVGMAEAHWDLAEHFKQHSVPDSAYYHFAEAQKLFFALRNELNAARMVYNMAVIQNSIKDYTGSEITTIRAIEIFKTFDEDRRLYLCYNLLGSINIGLKEYDRALEYYNEALEHLKKLEDAEVLIMATKNNIGMVYHNQEQYAKASRYFKEVLENDYLLERSPELYARTLANYAYNRFRFKDMTEVELQLKHALKIRDSINDISGLSMSHYYLSDYYLIQKDTAHAMSQALFARSYAEQSQNNERILETLLLLAQIDPKRSFAYTKEYIALNDSLQQEERKIRDKFARIQFETDEFIAQNETLVKEKQLWAGIAVVLLMLGLAIYIIADQRAKNQKLKFQQQQQEANKEIFNLMLSQNQKMEEGKKMEQKRISEELHDGVLGKLLGCRMVLTGLNKRADEEAVNERANAIESLKHAEGEIRDISHELSHSAYRDVPNFISSVNELLVGTAKTAGINTAFSHDENVLWDQLSGETKINLYRIIQESIQNVVKHAYCKNLVLTFAKNGDNLKIVIEDDGRGFEVKRKKRGIGVRNIHSRIVGLGGTWTIESKLGIGTKVRLVIPLIYHNVEAQMVLQENLDT